MEGGQMFIVRFGVESRNNLLHLVVIAHGGIHRFGTPMQGSVDVFLHKDGVEVGDCLPGLDDLAIARGFGTFIGVEGVVSLGALNLSSHYEQAYQQRLAHMEADSVENTVALNRLLAAGIALKVERNKEGDAYFLILEGAHKAAQPVNSPEGLAVEVWP
jgi:hypothetical protein